MSTTAANQTSLTFRYEPEVRAKKPTLQSQVQQIIAQRGAFRNINEKGLQAENGILKADNRDDDDVAMQDHSDEESEDEETFQARQEKLWKNRDEMLSKLSYAQNEVLSALDFVSLLLSSHNKAAQTSMSPALRERVEPSTLGARVVEYKRPSAQSNQRLNLVSEGWKLDSFKSAADKIEQASGRLARETEQQGKYWNQIADLKSRGWIISRLPSDNRSIGVHFGFPESAPQFRNRGFALLQQSETGDVDFDPRSIPQRRGNIKFAVVRNGVETGSYTTSLRSVDDGTDIHSKLMNARDALFEEELFYEINREARIIANQGILTRARHVEAEISDAYSIRIVQSSSTPARSESISGDYELACFFGLASRLLLTAQHTRLQARRSQPPAPMSLTPPSIPEYAILRPVVARLRHRDNLRKVHELCKTFAAPFESIGSSFGVEMQPDISSLSTPNEMTGVDLLRGKANSAIKLLFANERDTTLRLETYLGSPLFGTVFECLGIKFRSAEIKRSSMKDLEEVRALISHITLLNLVSIIDEITSRVSTSTVKWSLIRPHSGEFVVNRGLKTIARVMVSVKAGTVALNSVQMTEAGAPAKKAIYLWRADGLEKIPSDDGVDLSMKTLEDVVMDLTKALSE